MVGRQIATWTGASLLVLMVVVSARAEQSATCERQSAPHSRVATVEADARRATIGWKREGRKDWPRVHLSDPIATDVAFQALDLAAAALGEPECAKVLTEFTDRQGHALSDKLDIIGVDARDYLTMVVFLEETRYEYCKTGILAWTVPGSRVVWVCRGELKEIWAGDRSHVVAAFIHEMLHTLGLGENPPSSTQITKHVRARCSLK